jgi:hypothetical protein
MNDCPAGSGHLGSEERETKAERLAALARLFDGDGPPDLDEIGGPIHWPDLTGGEAAMEWTALLTWVEQLMVRFPHLDHHVIPRCWFRHNGHVEALTALRDHERVTYGDTAPGTAAVDWHRAFRDIEARLREWTGQLACGATHEMRSRQSHLIEPDEWKNFVDDDASRRDRPGVIGGLAE